MRISDWRSDVCSSDLLTARVELDPVDVEVARDVEVDEIGNVDVDRGAVAADPDFPAILAGLDLDAAAVAFGIDRDFGALPGLLLLRPAGGEEHHRGDEERETHGQSPWCISCIIHLGVGRVNSPSPLRHAGLDPASIPAAQSWTPDQVRGDDERYASMLVRTEEHKSELHSLMRIS